MTAIETSHIRQPEWPCGVCGGNAIMAVIVGGVRHCIPCAAGGTMDLGRALAAASAAITTGHDGAPLAKTRDDGSNGDELGCGRSHRRYCSTSCRVMACRARRKAGA